MKWYCDINVRNIIINSSVWTKSYLLMTLQLCDVNCTSPHLSIRLINIFEDCEMNRQWIFILCFFFFFFENEYLYYVNCLFICFRYEMTLIFKEEENIYCPKLLQQAQASLLNFSFSSLRILMNALKVIYTTPTWACDPDIIEKSYTCRKEITNIQIM